jgi:formylglycine-generating enzyme required for sulfatase activity
VTAAPSLATAAVPGGVFVMGDGDDTRRVPVAAFRIGTYPVTRDEYRRFIEASRRDAPVAYPSHPDAGRHPVTGVTWYAAVAFCDWLAEYDGLPWRLPVEAEWERAARGEDGRTYPWGDTFDPVRCATWEGGGAPISPVDAHPHGASPYGVMDLAGNVWEWTATDAVEPSGWRVLRGGSWYDTGWGVRASRRLAADPALPTPTTGFRVARSD